MKTRSTIGGSWRWRAVTSLLVALCLGGFAALGQTNSWQMASAPLTTRWAAEVRPEKVLSEYPRPQMVRPEWLSLNGLWDYAITTERATSPTNFDGQILVPFPVESALSGVARSLGAQSTLWYRRQFRRPAEWMGRNLRLHFGAVDWATRVFVNGREVGEHRGGYDPFTFDITAQLKPGEEQEILIAVSDPTEGDQPRGKQSRKPEGIFYTQVSGIWQTVWIEPVPAVSIRQLKLTPDLDARALRVRVEVSSLDDALRVEAVASATGAEVGHVTGSPNTELTLLVPTPLLWSPEDPFLYDLTVTLKQGVRAVDRVTSYFGMRKMGLQKDADGFVRMALNGRTEFQTGVLDQGFWPEGIYTAPTDAALRHDLDFLKAAGFKVVRKHVKVEPERWYYWCDKLGLLVWQDMPSANNNTREGRAHFETELHRMVAGLHNHPSIVMWVLFNEGWGQYDTEPLVECLQEADPSRLVNNASGWTDKQVGGILDAHSYPEPESPAPDERRASVLGEFGGLGLVVDGHAWPRPWAYHMLLDAPGFRAWYTHLLNEARRQHQSRGLSAAVYTQLTDVENECNGLLTYDLAVAKIAPETLAFIHRGGELGLTLRSILPNALSGQPVWKYTFEKPADHWFCPEFKVDERWREGLAGFGTAFTRGSCVRTLWDTNDIWLRRVFTLGSEDMRSAKLHLHHDKDAEVFLNGVLAFSGKGYLVDYGLFDIAPDAVAALRPGVNTIAVHCRQTTGGQFIDVGIVIPATETNTTPSHP